ncbi:ABC transporter substrate-binding protein [Marinobacter sp. 1_MG-2023]|uniref:substrate-binding periplasmic protein n=1 Tax=Marinobacter sp. 1_MG-2023 TaxID=3062627 RepID=UPI0026E29C9C|nr:transporter substrate-binding domain-containing protein [Marinobacter sp. 1_MG-2023]MDO6824280.1 transporter substrate-binding domain-containing protein [Marinobacter sp. 1_MG-2023]
MSGSRKKASTVVRRLLPVMLVLMVFCNSGAAEPACKTLTVSGNPEYPPLLWEDPQAPEHLTGAATALLREILEPLGVQLEVRRLGSWARVQRLARVGELDMVAGAFITSERIKYMDYLLPPFTYLPTAVWVPKDGVFEYRHWPDLKGKRGSTLINNSFGQRFDRYAERNLQVVSVRTIEQSFDMALAGRVDYVLYERLQGQVKLHRLGLADKFVALDVPISNEGLFFTFSKNSQCNTFEFRERIADRLFKLIDAGRMAEIVSEYTARYMSLEP